MAHLGLKSCYMKTRAGLQFQLKDVIYTSPLVYWGRREEGTIYSPNPQGCRVFHLFGHMGTLINWWKWSLHDTARLLLQCPRLSLEKQVPIPTPLHLTQANLQLHVQISTPSLETRMFLAGVRRTARGETAKQRMGDEMTRWPADFWERGSRFKRKLQLVYVRDSCIAAASVTRPPHEAPPTSYQFRNLALRRPEDFRRNPTASSSGSERRVGLVFGPKSLANPHKAIRKRSGLWKAKPESLKSTHWVCLGKARFYHPTIRVSFKHIQLHGIQLVRHLPPEEDGFTMRRTLRHIDLHFLWNMPSFPRICIPPRAMWLTHLQIYKVPMPPKKTPKASYDAGEISSQTHKLHVCPKKKHASNIETERSWRPGADQPINPSLQVFPLPLQPRQAPISPGKGFLLPEHCAHGRTWVPHWV